MGKSRVALTFILNDHSKPFEFRGKTYTSKTGFFGVDVSEEEASAVIDEAKNIPGCYLVKDSRNTFSTDTLQNIIKHFK